MPADATQSQKTSACGDVFTLTGIDFAICRKVCSMQGNRIKMLFLGDMEKFEEITSALDPRVKGRCKHKVSDIIIIAIATYLCGGDDYVSMYELCREPKTFGGTAQWLSECGHFRKSNFSN